MEYLVKLFSGEETKLYAGFLEGDVVLECLLCGLSGVLIADVGVESCYQHKRVVKVVVHLILVCLDSDSAVLVEGSDGLSKKSCGLEEVVSAYGHENIQLEVALACCHTNSYVVAHYLNCDHCYLLALSGVDLAGHDGGTGLVLGDSDLAETVSGSACQPSYIVGDLHHISSESLESTVSKYDLVLACKSVELVWSSLEILACKLGNSLCDLYIKALGGVKTCTNGSTAESKLFKLGKSDFKELLILFERGAPAADLLRESDGG